MKIIAVEKCTEALTDFIEECVSKCGPQKHKAFSRQRVKQVVEQVANAPTGFAVAGLSDTGDIEGFLLGSVLPELFSEETIGTVILWAVPKNPRLAMGLAEMFEGWAVRQGVHRIQYASPLVPRLDKLYKRRGFFEVERVYQKEK